MTMDRNIIQITSELESCVSTCEFLVVQQHTKLFGFCLKHYAFARQGETSGGLEFTLG